MGVVAFRALRFNTSMRLISFYRTFFMAKKAKLLRVRRKEKTIGRSMRLVANPAASGCHRTVDIFLSYVQVMALKAKLLKGQDERVRPPLVTSVTKPCGVRTVRSKAGPLGQSRSRRLSLGFHLLLLFRRRHPHKEKIQHLIFGCRLASGYESGN